MGTKIQHSLFALVVMAMLLLPASGMFVHEAQTMASQENRLLATMPPWPRSWQAVTEFPAAFSRFYDDHFAWRRQLIAWRSAIKVLALGVTSHADVVLGRQGWLYYDAEQQLADYRGLHPFTAAELRQNLQALEERAEMLAQVKIPYLLVLAPNKHTIYPEYLPERFARIKTETRLDQIVQALQLSGRVPFCDLRDPLLKAKSGGQLYFKTDTHWNQRGAFVGYGEVMGEVRRWLPSVPILGPDAVSSTMGPAREHDLANFLVMNWYFREETPIVTVITPHGAKDTKFDPLLRAVTDPSQPPDRHPFVLVNPQGQGRIVIFRDSFCSDLVPYFGASFQESLYIWKKMSPNLMLTILRSGYWPDLVIEEVVERLATFH